MSETVNVRERPGGIYTNAVSTSRHHLLADEPESYGSADLGPTPYEYLCAALGACTTITLRMYANQKEWPVSHLSVDVSHKKRVDGEGKNKDIFTRVVTIEGDIDEAQRARMLQIADKCPVHKTLSSGSEVMTKAA